MKLPGHEQFIERVKEQVAQDHRLVGLLGGGSMLTGSMDEYSDLDFIVVYDPAHQEEIMEQRLTLVGSFGNLLSAFTGEHVGEPRLVICLYGPTALHVDIKLLSPAELKERVEDPLVLWERDREMSTILEQTTPDFPYPDPQWIEDRFWVWVHYGAAKLGRGELFECIDMITFLRGTVLGPLILVENGQLPRGVRKLEQQALGAITELEETVPSHNAESCYNAMQASIRIYQRLRQNLTHLMHKKEAEQVSVAYLNQVYNSLSTK
ncbi:nucleotidyltransferase domain-containing protein [Paenibacillus sp. HWE-109]|uniref:nucleotidyltransferase domain-containing protein n=1 Tax=Paenibacillus sp. HWE-109 TaxID=1306526 RepID=UPI001EDFE53B|nr:nucleotidyltransferase domain-containing protein [Paenibacillus sp. HWE-109]UKS27558.1 nucleotidyltransferase domain-containing protein [Paenibacillus sp. HWE-109]